MKEIDDCGNGKFIYIKTINYTIEIYYKRSNANNFMLDFVYQ